MALLQDLSTELLLLIAALLPPSDAFNLSTCSQSIWHKCTSVIEEHREFSERYRWLANPWTAFEAICKDPRIAYHVRNVGNIDAIEDFGAHTLCERETDEAHRQRCRTAAETTEALDGIDLEEVTEAIESEQHAKLLCVLMQMCPNATTFTFVDDYESGDDDQILNFLRRLSYTPETVRSGTLAKVTSAEIKHWDTENDIDGRFITYLIRIPSLRRLTGFMVGPGDGEGGTGALQLPVSNLTSLELRYSSLTLEDLELILSQIKALSRFVYEEGGAIVSYDTNADLCGVLALVVQHQAHSLQDLQITNSGSTWPDADELSPFTGFSDLHKLRSLHTEHKIFSMQKAGEDENESYYGHELSEAHQIGGDLPATLESLRLDCGSGYSPQDPLYSWLKTFVVAKQDHTPRLRTLRIPVLQHDGLDPGEWSFAQRTSEERIRAQDENKAALSEACEKQGVEFVCKHGWL